MLDQGQDSRAGPRSVGRVLPVPGSQASVGLRSSGLSEPDEIRPTVGKLLGIKTKKTLLIGVITDVSVQTMPIAREQGYHVTADLDLLGEIRETAPGTMRFNRGVTVYPAIG